MSKTSKDALIKSVSNLVLSKIFASAISDTSYCTKPLYFRDCYNKLLDNSYEKKYNYYIYARQNITALLPLCGKFKILNRQHEVYICVPAVKYRYTIIDAAVEIYQLCPFCIGITADLAGGIICLLVKVCSALPVYSTADRNTTPPLPQFCHRIRIFRGLSFNPPAICIYLSICGRCLYYTHEIWVSMSFVSDMFFCLMRKDFIDGIIDKQQTFYRN